MSARPLTYAVLGWLVPLVVSLPLMTTYEGSIGGVAVLTAGIAWLLFLGPVGCVVAGWLGSRYRPRATALWSGLLGCTPAVVPVIAADYLVTVLTIGSVAIVAVLPLAVAYAVGFAAGTVLRSRRSEVT